MGGIADTPSKVGKKEKLALHHWVGFLVLGLLFTTLAWGSTAIHIGDVKGLELQVEFRGYQGVAHNGEFLYSKGRALAYQINLINRSNLSFSELEVQSSLHSDGVTCETKTLYPGTKLPGEALSPVHTVSIPPGGEYDYEVIYQVPPQICNSSGNLKVRLQYNQRGRIHSSTLIAPVHYQFE